MRAESKITQMSMKCFSLNLLVLVSSMLPAMADEWPRMWADSDSQKVALTYPEPIVSQTIVRNRYRDDKDSLADKDLGRDIVCITGDDRHKPTVEWNDQDCVHISFPVGTSCTTEYKFRLKPGTRYLGGAEAPQTEMTVSCPPDRLEGFPFMDSRGLGIMVSAVGQITRESRGLSADSGVRFIFRQATRHGQNGEITYEGGVEATQEPAYLKQGATSNTLRMLDSLGESVWKNFSPETPLPGHVVVRPVSPLDPEKEWHLLVKPEKGQGFSADSPVCTNATPQPELGSGVEWELHENKTCRLHVFFSSPMNAAEMPALFERMQLAVGEQVAETAGEGKKRLMLNGRPLEFCYDGVEELPSVGPLWGRRSTALTYTPQGQARGFYVEVSAPAPANLDVVLPADTASYLGWKMAAAHRHRISLNPAWPVLKPGERIIVPLKGDRTLRLPCANLGAVKVSAWRVAESQKAPALVSELSHSAAMLAGKLEYDLLKERDWRDLNVEKNAVSRAEKALERLRKREKIRAANSSEVLQGAAPLPGTQVPVGGDGMLQSGEAVFSLDAATGGAPAPGMYLLRLQPQANAAVRSSLQQSEHAAHFLDSQVDVLVQVTDLNVTVGNAAILVNRFSDGAPVDAGTVTYRDKQGQQCRLPVQNGVAWLPEKESVAGVVEVRCGDDAVLVDMGRSSARRSAASGARESAMLILDRQLYRPGDVVNLRGILRRRLADGSCEIPTEKTARLTINGPDGEEMETREVSLGEFGAFEAQFTLPEGEDDVTGGYPITMECGDFSQCVTACCQIFRRDAFKADLELEVDPVAPQHYTVRVSATDYSGVPLAGAACSLSLGQDEVELKLDAAGKACITREVTKQMRDVGMVFVRGSVSDDREEYVQMGGVCKRFYSADFSIDVDKNRLKLNDVRGGSTLGREQSLNLKLIKEQHQPVPGENGLGKEEKVTTVYWSGTLSVPANCESGVPLPFDAQEKYPDATAWLISGRDAEGRETSRMYRLRFYRRDAGEPQLKAEYREGGLELSCELPRAAQAHLLVGCGQKLRHLVLPVQAGKQVLRVPLLEGEEGTVSATLVLPAVDAQTKSCVCSSLCFVPVRKYHLDVELQLPKQVCRPAETVTLAGRVLAAGKPADAEVTLYAVDAGMLSVARYKKPDPESFFCRGAVRNFNLRGGYHRPTKQNRFSLMPGLWRGDMVGKGYSLTPVGMGTPPMVIVSGGGVRYARAMKTMNSAAAPQAVAAETGGFELEVEMDAEAPDGNALVPGMGLGVEVAGAQEAPRLRTNFAPVALWQGALRTDAGGRFSAEVTLPDTLTTYRVFAVALDKSGKRFGSAEGEFTVAQPVMLTPGTPLFMSLGDELRLPLSIVNNTAEAGTWKVTLEGAEAPQEITLAAHQSGTLFFDFKAATEGEQKLRWIALGKPGSDAVQGEFAVRFPAPVLKEVHRLAFSAAEGTQTLASLLGTEVAAADRGRMALVVSANPLLHLAGAADFLLEYPYGCTEQRASALIPWLLYKHLAPFCPRLAQTAPEKVAETVDEIIDELLKRQCEDGGLSYWGGNPESCLWASAHAAYVLKLAQEQGYDVPQEQLDKLLFYLWNADTKNLSYRAQFCIARTRGKSGAMMDILREALGKKNAHLDRETLASMRFILSLLEIPAGADAAFRTWMRTAGRDYRHGTTQSHAWTLLALVEYLHLRKNESGEATVVLNDGTELRLGRGTTIVPLSWQPGQEMKSLPTTLTASEGTVYATFSLRALPPTSEYPGVTECGLQVTRIYESKGSDGIWRPVTEFKVGDVVRVTLTCAKVAPELKYLVLEDYLPACMEAINPHVPGQAAGLEPTRWSWWFDHREYLADRVRGFCTRWEGRDLLNMQYYARVKRAGTSFAPPAQAQLMYEPQVYGLSPNTRVLSKP